MSNLIYPQNLFGTENEYNNLMAITLVKVTPSQIKEIANASRVDVGDYEDGETVVPTKSSNLSQQFRRSENTIYVPAPNNVNFNESHSWEAGNFGIFRNFSNPTSEGKSLLQNIGQSAKNSLAVTVNNLTSLGNESLKNAQSDDRQAIINPHMEILYRSPNFRTFQFTYKFVPLESSDCDSILNIIKTMRYAGATSPTVVKFLENNDNNPSQTFSSDNWFAYPSEFRLQFLMKTEEGGIRENPYISRIKNCVMTDLSLNYTAVGKFATYENGFPAEIEMTVSFTETEIILKDSILEGY